jgi:hypothetical protein
MNSIQYTVRGVPPALDAVLRSEARANGKTLNALVVETLEQAKLPREQTYKDLDWFIGAAPSRDEGMDAALAWLDALPTEPA